MSFSAPGRERERDEESGAKFAFARLCWVEYPGCSLNSIDSVFGVRVQVFQGTRFVHGETEFAELSREKLSSVILLLSLLLLLLLSSSWFTFFQFALCVFLAVLLPRKMEIEHQVSKYFFEVTFITSNFELIVEIDTEATSQGSFRILEIRENIIMGEISARFNFQRDVPVTDYELRGSIDNGRKDGNEWATNRF